MPSSPENTRSKPKPMPKPKPQSSAKRDRSKGRAKARSSVEYNDMISDDDYDMYFHGVEESESINTAPKKKKCHMCRQSSKSYLKCHFFFDNGNKCNKVYCQTCLEDRYDTNNFEDLVGDTEWHCPSCLGIVVKVARQKIPTKSYKERSNSHIRTFIEHFSFFIALFLECDSEPPIETTQVLLSSLDETSFNAIDLPFCFDVIGPAIDTNYVSLNITTSSSEDIVTDFTFESQSNNNEQQFCASDSFLTQEGKTDISVSALTVYGDEVFYSAAVWCGEESVPVYLEDEDTGNSYDGIATVTLTLSDDVTVSAVKENVIGGFVEFDNVPPHAVYVSAIGEEQEIGFGYAIPIIVIQNVTIDMLGFNEPSQIDNNDFSQGLDGWDVSSNSSIANLVDHVEEVGPSFNPVAENVENKIGERGRDGKAQIMSCAPISNVFKRQGQTVPDYDLIVNTGGIYDGTRRVSRTFTVEEGVYGVAVRYRFSTCEVPGGFFGSEYNDFFYVNLRSLDTTGNSVGVHRSMNSLGIAAFDTDGSTDWSVLKLRLDGSVENTVQIDLGVANVVDGLFPSSIHVDFLHKEKKLFPPDEEEKRRYGYACSMSNSRFVIGAFDMGDNDKGAAYLYDLDGNLIKKLTSGSDGQSNDEFGYSVSIDEKIVVGINTNTPASEYVRVFSQEGIYERPIKCNDCQYFGRVLDTFGERIVIVGSQNNSWKLFIYSTTTGNLLNSLEQGSDWIYGVAMSEQIIVSTARDGKTIVHSNTVPDFHQIAKIPQAGTSVAIFGERMVIGNGYFSSGIGAAYLYKTDGTFIKELKLSGIQPATVVWYHGWSVDITADRIFVGTYGSIVSIFSASTGEFEEKIVRPDTLPNDDYDYFGMSVCASSSHYVVGAAGVDSAGGIENSGAAYLFV